MGAFQKGDRLDVARLKRCKVPLPELGEGKYLLVRALSAAEVRAWSDAKGADTSDYALVAACAVAEDGTPVFDDADDARQNLDVSAESVLTVIQKILDLSGIPTDRAKN